LDGEWVKPAKAWLLPSVPFNLHSSHERLMCSIRPHRWMICKAHDLNWIILISI
jgi:hypothetical protein